MLQSEVQHLKAGVTLSHKCLAGVEENLAALHDHALDCQVLPDVFGLAHLVVHDSRGKRTFCHSSLNFIGLHRIKYIESYGRCSLFDDCPSYFFTVISAEEVIFSPVPVCWFVSRIIQKLLN